jgi:hypothetical protein
MMADFPLPTERTDYLYMLAKEYYERCDAFDAKVCSGKGRDGPMPVGDEEFRAVNRNAAEVLRDVRKRAYSAGHTAGELQAAMHEYMRFTRSP